MRKKSFASCLMGRDGRRMLADANNGVKKRVWASGGRFAGGNAADAARYVETVLGAAAILHPREDLRKTDPGLHTVHIGFERALEALEGAQQVPPIGVNPPLACPQGRPACAVRERPERIKAEGGLRSAHALQHLKLLSRPCGSIGTVTKSRMCPPATSSPRQPASPSSLPSANEG